MGEKGGSGWCPCDSDLREANVVHQPGEADKAIFKQWGIHHCATGKHSRQLPTFPGLGIPARSSPLNHTKLWVVANSYFKISQTPQASLWISKVKTYNTATGKDFSSMACLQGLWEEKQFSPRKNIKKRRQILKRRRTDPIQYGSKFAVGSQSTGGGASDVSSSYQKTDK